MVIYKCDHCGTLHGAIYRKGDGAVQLPPHWIKVRFKINGTEKSTYTGHFCTRECCGSFDERSLEDSFRSGPELKLIAG